MFGLAWFSISAVLVGPGSTRIVATSSPGDSVWGAEAQCQILERLPNTKGKPPFTMYDQFTASWNNPQSRWRPSKPKRFSFEEIGYWRMTPMLIETSPKGTGHAPGLKIGFAGSFRRRPASRPVGPSGWKVIGIERLKREIPVKFGFAAVAGGGVEFTIPRPADFALESIGLKPDSTYVADSSEAWVCPWSRWLGRARHVGRSDFSHWLMKPFLVVEFARLHLVQNGTHNQTTRVQPTGWAVMAGRFASPDAQRPGW